MECSIDWPLLSLLLLLLHSTQGSHRRALCFFASVALPSGSAVLQLNQVTAAFETGQVRNPESVLQEVSWASNTAATEPCAAQRYCSTDCVRKRTPTSGCQCSFTLYSSRISAKSGTTAVQEETSQLGTDALTTYAAIHGPHGPEIGSVDNASSEFLQAHLSWSWQARHVSVVQATKGVSTIAQAGQTTQSGRKMSQESAATGDMTSSYTSEFSQSAEQSQTNTTSATSAASSAQQSASPRQQKLATSDISQDDNRAVINLANSTKVSSLKPDTAWVSQLISLADTIHVANELILTMVPHSVAMQVEKHVTGEADDDVTNPQESQTHPRRRRDLSAAGGQADPAVNVAFDGKTSGSWLDALWSIVEGSSSIVARAKQRLADVLGLQEAHTGEQLAPSLRGHAADKGCMEQGESHNWHNSQSGDQQMVRLGKQGGVLRVVQNAARQEAQHGELHQMQSQGEPTAGSLDRSGEQQTNMSAGTTSGSPSCRDHTMAQVNGDSYATRDFCTSWSACGRRGQPQGQHTKANRSNPATSEQPWPPGQEQFRAGVALPIEKDKPSPEARLSDWPPGVGDGRMLQSASVQDSPGSLVELFIARLRALRIGNALAVTSSQEAAQKLTSLGLPAVAVPYLHFAADSDTDNVTMWAEQLQSGQGDRAADVASPPFGSYSYVKTAALRALSAADFSVLYADVDVLLLKSPFEVLYRDSDFEAASGDDLPEPKAAGHQYSIEDPAMGWGHVGYQVNHPYFDAGLFYVRPGQGSQRALRLVAREVERELDNPEVRSSYNALLYSPHLPLSSYWKAFAPHIPSYGSSSDQQWLLFEHQRRLWEIIFNRVLTHQHAPVEDILPDGTIAGTAWPKSAESSFDLNTGRKSGDSSTGYETLVLIRRILSSRLFATSLKWSANGWAGGRIRYCQLMVAMHANAHPDKLRRLMLVGKQCGLKQEVASVGELQQWVVVKDLESLISQQGKVQICAQKQCAGLSVTEEDLKQGAVKVQN